MSRRTVPAMEWSPWVTSHVHMVASACKHKHVFRQVYPASEAFRGWLTTGPTVPRRCADNTWSGRPGWVDMRPLVNWARYGSALS